jgi:hypothetical protein
MPAYAVGSVTGEMGVLDGLVAGAQLGYRLILVG